MKHQQSDSDSESGSVLASYQFFSLPPSLRLLTFHFCDIYSLFSLRSSCYSLRTEISRAESWQYAVYCPYLWSWEGFFGLLEGTTEPIWSNFNCSNCDWIAKRTVFRCLECPNDDPVEFCRNCRSENPEIRQHKKSHQFIEKRLFTMKEKEEVLQAKENSPEEKENETVSGLLRSAEQDSGPNWNRKLAGKEVTLGQLESHPSSLSKTASNIRTGGGSINIYISGGETVSSLAKRARTSRTEYRPALHFLRRLEFAESRVANELNEADLMRIIIALPYLTALNLTVCRQLTDIAGLLPSVLMSRVEPRDDDSASTSSIAPITDSVTRRIPPLVSLSLGGCLITARQSYEFLHAYGASLTALKLRMTTDAEPIPNLNGLFRQLQQIKRLRSLELSGIIRFDAESLAAFQANQANTGHTNESLVWPVLEAVKFSLDHVVESVHSILCACRHLPSLTDLTIRDFSRQVMPDAAIVEFSSPSSLCYSTLTSLQLHQISGKSLVHLTQPRLRSLKCDLSNCSLAEFLSLFPSELASRLIELEVADPFGDSQFFHEPTQSREDLLKFGRSLFSGKFPALERLDLQKFQNEEIGQTSLKTYSIESIPLERTLAESHPPPAQLIQQHYRHPQFQYDAHQLEERQHQLPQPFIPIPFQDSETLLLLLTSIRRRR